MDPLIEHYDDYDIEIFFQFLDNLRTSGLVNMFGSPIVLAETHEIPINHAKLVVVAWMESFSTRHPQDEPEPDWFENNPIAQ